MLLVLINWIYMGVVCCVLGMTVRAFVKRTTGYQIKHLGSILMSGLIVSTCYAQFFSLVGSVSAGANLVLILICILLLVLFRKDYKEYLGKRIQQRKKRSRKTIWIYTLVCGIAILWMAYWTSRGYIHYDTDLYHAQSIRWIEEYGIVKGLGNLHFRFAYNSSLFAVSALFSLKWLTGQSLHCVNGFIGLLLLQEILRIFDSFSRRRIEISDFARTAAFYYLVIVVDEMISPASDYAIMFTIFWIVIKWLDQLELDKREKRQDKKASERIAPYALLCVAGAHAVTLKLTAGLLLILVIKPVVEIWQAAGKDKRSAWKQIGGYLLAGCLLVLPWMIRTAIISGYLLYPMASLDVFSVDYKMPREAVLYDANEIKVWGRALYDVSLIDTGMTEWLPNWFRTTLSGMEKAIIVADGFVLLATFVYWCCLLYRRNRGKKVDWNLPLVMLALCASYLFWQTSAPLIRYGYAYCLLMIAVFAGIFVDWIRSRGNKMWIERLIFAMLVLLFLWKGAAMTKETFYHAKEPYYLVQKEYGTYSLMTKELGSETLYIPREGDQVGYDAFPAIPYDSGVKMRGERFEDGFCQ